MPTPTPCPHPQDSFAAACWHAERRSRADECTIHVGARVAVIHGVPTIIGFTLDDWHDAATLRTYTDGKTRDA